MQSYADFKKQADFGAQPQQSGRGFVTMNNGVRTVSAGNVPGFQNMQPRNIRRTPTQVTAGNTQQGRGFVTMNNGVRTVSAGNVPGFQNAQPRNIGGRGNNQGGTIQGQQGQQDWTVTRNQNGQVTSFSNQAGLQRQQRMQQMQQNNQYGNITPQQYQQMVAYRQWLMRQQALQWQRRQQMLAQQGMLGQ
jgi:hypothetical protein